jgi:hypothetical protein
MEEEDSKSTENTRQGDCGPPVDTGGPTAGDQWPATNTAALPPSNVWNVPGVGGAA